MGAIGVLSVCVSMRYALHTSGLFRAGSSVKRCKELRKSFDEGGFPEFDSWDILTSASLLKVFLRELPGGLIPEPHRTQLLKVLPEEHLNVLCYLMFFLSRVAAESHLNLMTSKNLSIVFGPNIFQ
uniref:Rho-GAP domain-containing protein n=1 Tax=Sinocyclocheilus rhinocerous TaxID=307959 RepID=A0A673M5L0_9TELE